MNPRVKHSYGPAYDFTSPNNSMRKHLGSWKQFRSSATARHWVDGPLATPFRHNKTIGREEGSRRLVSNHIPNSTRLTVYGSPWGTKCVRIVSPIRSAHPQQPPWLRTFQSASEYNSIADASLETLQGALDDWLEDNHLDNNTTSETEVMLASGVLTLKLPPHGTWVINKQSATQQIWWSSPLSGPKRFEFSDGAWWSTKDGLNMTSQLAQELQHCFPQSSPFTVGEE
jgi:frataxin